MNTLALILLCGLAVVGSVAVLAGVAFVMFLARIINSDHPFR